MFFFGKPKSYLGVDVGAGGVKMVELKIEKNRPVLFTYGLTSGGQDVHRLVEKKEMSAEQLAQGADKKEDVKTSATSATSSILSVDQRKVDEYAGFIKAVCKASRSVSTTVFASLPVSAVFHAVVTLPIVKKEEFNHIVQAEVKKLLPMPLEEMVLDAHPLATVPEDKAQRVLVNAVPRTLVAFYTQVFKRAGLQLDSLEPESVALSRSLIGKDTAVTVLVDIGAERTNFFIVDQAVPVTHHSVELGGVKINQIFERVLGVPADLTEQMKRDLFSHLIETREDLLPRARVLELFNQIVEPITKEIEYSLELYLRQTANVSKRPEKVVLTGGGAFFPYLTDIISEKFQMKCYIGDPWGRVVFQDSLKPLLNAIAPRMAVAIGLALRSAL